MTYRVEWTDPAQMALLEMWATLDSPAFRRISSAVVELERRLSTDPDNEGESRDSELRITFEEPLGITFNIDPDDRLASIIAAWLIKDREERE